MSPGQSRVESREEGGGSACRKSHTEVAMAVMERGADIDARDEY